MDFKKNDPKNVQGTQKDDNRTPLQQAHQAQLPSAEEAQQAKERAGTRDPNEARKLYRLHAPHYRNGEMIPAGSVVSIAPRFASRYWTEVDKKGNPVNPPEEQPKSPTIGNESIMVTLPPQADHVVDPNHLMDPNQPVNVHRDPQLYSQGEIAGHDPSKTALVDEHGQVKHDVKPGDTANKGGKRAADKDVL